MKEPPRASGGTVSERRRLAVLFVDLSGSTVLGRAMEAEDYAELMAQLRDVWHQSAARHGGRVVRVQGDGALIVFGHPCSDEDDSKRAVDAALDIRRQVTLLRPASVPQTFLPLSVHSGIHAGTLLLSPGDIERGLFDLQGDVVNTAASLSQRAMLGQVLVSRDALGPHANLFQLQEPSASPGQTDMDPSAWAVVGRSANTRRFDATAQRGLTPFVGRDRLVALLRRFLDTSARASKRCLLVIGSAGLGKTRLLEEVLAQRGHDRDWLWRGSCENYSDAAALQPFLQMLSSRGNPAATDAAGGKVAEILAHVTARLAAGPLVIVIDDWQWADDASRQLMEALLQTSGELRVILACRPRDDGTHWIADAASLTLAPFVREETDVAVRRWLPQADPFLVDKIHAYSGGVPLFIEELCHSVPGNSLQRMMEGRGATQGWLATLVASRLGRLPADHAEIVRAAAVIGNVVPRWLLACVCAQAPSPLMLQALADADFLYADQAGTLRFKHGITRDSVYEAIGLHDRRALHRRIEAALLQQVEQADADVAVEALAYHSRGAGHWESAALYAERAGDKATAEFALDYARAQYQAAMQALDSLPQRTRNQSLRWCLLANKLGMTCIFDPLSLNDDLGVFERAVQRARELGDADALARAQYWLGYMCYGFGRFNEAVVHAREALALARETDNPRLAAQIEASLGEILIATCQYDEAIPIIDAAVSAKRQRARPGGGMAIGSAFALACKGSALADRGEFDAAHACFDEATGLLAGSTHPVANSVRNWVLVSLVWQGRWHEAGLVAAECSRIAENTRSLLLLAVCRGAAGFARWVAGNEDGLQQLRDAAHWMAERRGQFYTSLHYGWLAEASVAEGDFAAARLYAMQALRRARAGEQLGEAVACRALALAAAQQQRWPVAWRWLRRTQRSAARRGSAREAAMNEALRGRLLQLQGEGEAGRRALADAAAAFGAMAMHWHAEQVARGGATP